MAAKPDQNAVVNAGVWLCGRSTNETAKCCFFHERLVRMNKTKLLVHLVIIGLGVVLLTALTGCIGWVGGGGDGYYDDGGSWGGWWGGGGGYDRGRDVHAYSARGAASRGAAHGGGGHGGGGHGGGGKR